MPAVNASRSFLLLTLLCAGASIAAPDGARIYRAECARCHGKQGEGVAKKYKQPLVGDWSVARLTRYIAKEMPEDDPESLDAEQAAAVAAYLHDAFYSREARARNQPARVELVRLTNRQYLETLADLVAGDQRAGAVGPERGLKAVYRNDREKWKDKEGRAAVDPVLDFDFGDRLPDGQAVATNGFSVEWKGSLLAPETGEYTFTLRTPNGARLWLNDPDEPLIDAYVASGTNRVHTARIRLIGGRAYPLRVDMFRFKEKTAALALRWKPPHGVDQVIPEHALARDEARPSFVVRTPFPADDSSVGYERGVLVSKAWDEAATRAAVEVAAEVVRRADERAGTKPDDTQRVAKLQAYAGRFVARAFRRPLTPDQQALFVAGPFKDAPSPEEAIKRVVLLALKSPRFLYLGLGGAGDDHAVAERLSFGLWDSLPDAELRQAAEGGRLRTRAQVVAQAERMLGDPRARAKVRSFLHHWLQMDRVDEVGKDPALFPDFSPDLIADLKTSLDLFLDDVVWTGASDYRQLLQADYLFVNERLARFYGLSGGSGTRFAKVKADTGQRAGVLTHPYLLAAFSYSKSTSPIHRGVFLTRNIVGRELRPPPMAVAFKDGDFKPGMTMREKVEELTRPDACQTCHSLINPLGFSLEHFDAVGRFRTKDGERPVQAASQLPMDDGTALSLDGPRDIAQYAVSNPQAHGEFIEQLFHQVAKQPLRAYGVDTATRLRESFAASQFNVRKLLVDIASIAALQGRADATGAAAAGGAVKGGST